MISQGSPYLYSYRSRWTFIFSDSSQSSWYGTDYLCYCYYYISFAYRADSFKTMIRNWSYRWWVACCESLHAEPKLVLHWRIFLISAWFSFFYVSITFNTTDVAENIQKRGWYIPWVRPGKETATYLQHVSDRLNLWGWWFLALIAVFPYLMTRVSTYAGFSFSSGNIDFLISGSGLIIVVGVILDIIRRIDTDMKSFDYKKFH